MLTNLCHQQSNVQSTQEIVELVLDSNRNELLALDLKVRTRSLPVRLVSNISQISIWTMGIGMGTLVAGLFGMNVRVFQPSVRHRQR